MVSVGFVALLWVVEIVDQLTPGATLDDNGIQPRTDEGLLGVLLAPLLHGGWGHLISNSGLALLLLFLVLVGDLRRGLLATAIDLGGGRARHLAGRRRRHQPHRRLRVWSSAG